MVGDKCELVLGDCLEKLKELPDNSVDLVVTSPPYNCGIEYDCWDDNLDWEKYYLWCEGWLKQIYRVLKGDGRFCLNHYLSLGQAGNRHAPLMKLNELCVRIGFKHYGLAVWTDATLSKRTAWGSWMSASAPYVNSPYEGVLFLYKNEWKKRKRGKSTIGSKDFMKACSGVWDIPTDRARLTPATFPLELPELCINLLSYEGDLVLDPFMGSGTTGVAALKLNRRFVGVEVSPEYFAVAEKRISDWKNQTRLSD